MCHRNSRIENTAIRLRLLPENREREAAPLGALRERRQWVFPY